MTDKAKNITFLILALIVAGLLFFLGYRAYPKWNPEIIHTDTIPVYDSFPYTIHDTVPDYHIIKDSVKYRDPKWMDSVIKANKVDTAGLFNIVRNYFAVHFYERSWKDSAISVIIKDAITQNRPGSVDLTYKILRPQQVVNSVINKYSYSKYLYIGITVQVKDLRNADFGLFYAFSRGLVGIGYNPLLKNPSLSAGYRIIKIK